jgi:hypothetical protein
MKKLLYGALIMTVLVSTAVIAFGEDWKTYTNKKNGFSVEYPDIYEDKNTVERSDGDGVYYSGSNHSFSVVCDKNDGKQTPASELKRWTNMEEDEDGIVDGVEPLPDTAKTGDNFFTLDYLQYNGPSDNNGDPANITHVYGIVTKKLVVWLELSYPKEEAEEYAEIKSRADKSLKVTGK